MSSYRSNASSTRLRRILRGSDHIPESNRTDETHTIDNRSRMCSHEDSSPPEKPTSDKSASKKRSSKDPNSESPVMTFFRILFDRCFTSRRKKRSRKMAMRKMENNTYKKRDQFIKNSGTSSRIYSTIPTNEQEMFSMLHRSKTRHKSPVPSPYSSLKSNASPKHRRENSGITTSIDALPSAISISPPLFVIDSKVEQVPLEQAPIKGQQLLLA